MALSTFKQIFLAVTSTVLLINICSAYPIEYDLHDPVYLEQLTNSERINSVNYVNKADDLEPFDNPKDKDNVHLEYEGIPSKILTAYDSTHEKISRVVNNTPVVDNTKEEDKEGNNGSLTGLAKGIIGVVEFVSNLLNKVVEAPGNLFANAWESARVQLNGVGGKIVGLKAYDQ